MLLMDPDVNLEWHTLLYTLYLLHHEYKNVKLFKKTELYTHLE